MTVRPRPGDLEAATRRHPPVRSGRYVGTGIELCDLCNLSWPSPMHVMPTDLSDDFMI